MERTRAIFEKRMEQWRLKDTEAFQLKNARAEQAKLLSTFKNLAVFNLLDALVVDPHVAESDDNEKWDLQIQDVIKKPNGKYDTNLKLLYSQSIPHTPNFYKIVQIEYTHKGKIKVTGFEQTVNEDLFQYNDTQVTEYREALSRVYEGIIRAFENPNKAAASVRRVIPQASSLWK